MRFKTLGWMGLVTLFMVSGASPSYAQDMHVTADIPFAFHAEGKTLPAGHYDFRATEDGAVIQVTSKQKKDEALVPVVTRMAGAIHEHANDSHLVFDDVNGVYTLSELWVAGSDGVLLHATKGPHKHQVVTVPK